MASFSFQVDREYQVVKPLVMHANLALSGETVALPDGQALVYRGTVELPGGVRYVFEHEGRKVYALDRMLLQDGLAENYDALIRIR